MNKVYLRLPINNQGLQVPIELKWDFLDRSDSIELFEDEIIREVIGSPNDFEITRFAHDVISEIDLKTDINYEFYFWNTGSVTPISATTIVNEIDWKNSYIFEGFNTKEIYYYTKPFTNSFFKLDFYDTNDTTTQTNYFTIIIPVQQGFVTGATISPYIPNVQIKIPKFKLDYVGDKEGFFIYWLRDRKYIDIDTFHMTAKFFDAKIGVFVKMMNTPQSSLAQGNKFTFDGTTYFYYKVELDYDKRTYQVFDRTNTRIGTNNPIKWYEYINQ